MYVQQQMSRHFPHPILSWTSKGYWIIFSLSTKESLKNSGVRSHPYQEHIICTPWAHHFGACRLPLWQCPSQWRCRSGIDTCKSGNWWWQHRWRCNPCMLTKQRPPCMSSLYNSSRRTAAEETWSNEAFGSKSVGELLHPLLKVQVVCILCVLTSVASMRIITMPLHLHEGQ